MHIVQKEERFDKVCEEGKSSFETNMHALWNGELSPLGFNNKSSCHSDFADLGNDKLLGNFADNKFFHDSLENRWR